MRRAARMKELWQRAMCSTRLRLARRPQGANAGRSPFSRYDKQHITMDYGCYRRDTWNYSEADGCNLNLKLTYSFGYGKKQERGNTEIDKRINSAIMRTY